MSLLRRAFTIGSRIAAYLAWLATRRIGFAAQQSPARRFARLLEDLGTPFVKLGQHLSLRRDLLPPDYLEAL